jgi:hypothetical protein
MLALEVGDNRANGANAFLQLGQRHDERRREPKHALAGWDDEHPRIVKARKKFTRHETRPQHETPKKALAARQLAYTRKVARQLRETRAKRFPFDAGSLDEIFLIDRTQYGQACRAGEGVAPKGRSMAARRQRAGNLLGREHGPDGEAAAEPLGKRNGIGFRATALAAQESPQPADSDLHFVDQEQSPVLTGHRPQFRKKARRCGYNAALALYRLDNDGAHIGAHRPLNAFCVAVGNMGDRTERAEALSILWCPGHRERAQGATVKRVLKRDDANSVLVPFEEVVVARELEQTLVRLGTRVAEQRPRETRSTAQFVGETNARLVVKVVGHVDESRSLFGDGAHQDRVGVPERAHGHAGAQVEPPSAVGIK